MAPHPAKSRASTAFATALVLLTTRAGQTQPPPDDAADQTALQSAGEAAVEGVPANEPYKQTIDAAIEAFRRRDLELAEQLFNDAHALSPSARTLRGLGVVALERSRYVRAVEYLTAALQSPVKPLDPELRASTSELLRRAEQHVGRLRVTVQPADARLRLDGAPLLADQSVVVDAGRHVLEAERDGYESEQRSLQVHPEQQQTSVLALTPFVVPAAQQLPAQAKTDSRSWRRNPWLWTGVSVVLAGSAAAMAAAWAPRERPADGGSTQTVVGQP